ncbi:hypothetical protein ANN_24006 [Periplaneta americana]|uniref:ATPase AAA-type core domain-containing protein n=1 Tax=Periplaneta americana TaxID=6978 RepID=A0ABQ8S1X2_PERAM|nr:hypothetical protein ANN_24006 [Periplaneta americana]
MSNVTYNKLWGEAQNTINEATEYDTVLHAAPYEKDKRAAQIWVSELYVKYVTVVNKLDQCYDQIVHPQKRLVIRKLLDACIGRVLELKHELVNLDLSEFSYYDDVLLKLKILPMEVEINVPNYYRREREDELKKRKKAMDDILKKLGFYEEEVIEEEMTEEEAIRLIQRHERARQGRLRSQFMKEIRLMKEKGKAEVPESKAFDISLAAIKIQKTWRGYSTRHKMKRRKLDEMLLIGMLQSSFTEVKARRRAEEVKEIRRKLQKEYQTEYEEMLVSEKQHIKTWRGGHMKEDIGDEVRTWITDYWHETGKFPDMPSEESGGSTLFFTRQAAESEISKTTTSSSSNISAVRAIPGRTLSTTRCRHPDCSELETLGHVLGQCPKGELLINARHHRVRHALAISLKTLNWEIHEEVHCVSSDGSFRRADIIAINGRLKWALVLDPTIRFERNLNQATEVDIEKKSIYEPCLPYLSQKYNVPLKQWSVIGLLFGSRDSITKFTWNYLKELHIPFDYVIEGKGKKDKGKKDKEEGKKKKDDEEDDLGFKMQPSNFLGDIQAASTEHEAVWRYRDESQNPWQHADVEIIKEQKTAQVEAELRRNKSFEVHEEVHCVVSEGGGIRRADIVALDKTNSKGFILDPTFRFEMSQTQPSEVNKEKQQIYEPTIPYFREKYQMEGTWEVHGLMIGARGTIPRSTVNTIKTFGIHDIIPKIITSTIKGEVDQLLRAELEVLQAALARDLASKGKKVRKASKKKGRSGKKSKKKKEKDLTPDRTLESLFEELITNGIIRKYPEVQLSEFRGERSYAADDLRKLGKDPLPSLGDIRQVILEYCILPLGSKAIHQTAPLVKSVLLAGSRGSGKDMLVHAVCTETGAVLFDLSPANIVGKYPGKSGLIMLVHLVNKVSRLLQPSVIYMDGAEKPFLKKVPKTDKTDPKRLKKDLPKIVKGISQDDQIILIGVSRCPWDCDQKALAQTYSKMILIPRPDYGSLSFLWKELLFQFGGVSRQFDTAAMTKNSFHNINQSINQRSHHSSVEHNTGLSETPPCKSVLSAVWVTLQVSDGYTVGSILEVIKEVMTCKRALQLRVQPLTHAELINSLCKMEPVYKEEDEAFLQWFLKTPIGRRKARQLEIEAELRAELAPKPKKKN